MFAHTHEFGKIKSYSMISSVNTNSGYERQEYGLASAKKLTNTGSVIIIVGVIFWGY